MKWRVMEGNLCNTVPLSSQLYEALTKQGLSRAMAAWWILRQSIVLGGDNPRYDVARRRLERILKGGDAE